MKKSKKVGFISKNIQKNPKIILNKLFLKFTYQKKIFEKFLIVDIEYTQCYNLIKLRFLSFIEERNGLKYEKKADHRYIGSELFYMYRSTGNDGIY